MELPPNIQIWFNTILVWIGFGTLAGLLAQALLPKGKPEGYYGILVVGICGSCVGVFLVDVLGKMSGVDEFANVNPISPLGLFAAVIASILILLIYRLSLYIVNYFRRK
jgi:uncharacterized membrane protein YeaQ/YmgE (transglycosylase-associated protein family)